MKHLVFDPVAGHSISRLLADVIDPATGREHNVAEIEKLILQGSVYQLKRRLKDPGFVPPAEDGPCELFYPELPVYEFELDPRRVNYEDEDIVVVDKPAGVNTAPSPFSDIDCLSWGVERYLRKSGSDPTVTHGTTSAAGAAPYYKPAVIHRLDRDTQGLVFFAKHKKAELALHAAFRERRVRKIYQARCPVFEESPLGPRRGLYRIRDVLTWRDKAQIAATTILAIQQDSKDSLLWTVLPHTGRPHQIRKHFASYLAPLIGDRVYAPGLYGKDVELGLACAAYRLRHPLSGRVLRLQRM